MNKIKLATVFLFVASIAVAQTAEVTESATSINVGNVIVGILGVMVFVLLLLVFTLQKVVYMLSMEAKGLQYPTATETTTTWEKLLSLKPLSAEKDVELDHDFDGIKELNNPIPFWFNLLFYGTIVIGFIYMLVFHVFETGVLQAKEYENELTKAEIDKKEYVKKAGNLVDENNVVLLTDASRVQSGLTTYTAKCAVCHGDKGEGKVGPNLTDQYWLHGGDMRSVFSTIKYGVPSKGMVAWQNSLNGGQIQELASYIMTLQGTNPPGSKEPQGELYAPESAKPADSTTTTK
ncbi:MAG: cytochrome C [Bacteroidetes bacterium]|nr:MAG: cytochrome C [Bacteroidota bacterium]